MNNNEKIIINVNKKHIIVMVVIICMLLLIGFLFDDYKYWRSSFGFDKGDEYTTKAIETWDRYGCTYFYKEDQKEALDNYESMLKDDNLVVYVKRTTAIYGIINLYSDKDIEAAFNAIVYGCNNSDHDTGKYRSVADIPERLFRNCYLEMIMPNNMDESIKEVYEQYLYELKD